MSKIPVQAIPRRTEVPTRALGSGGLAVSAIGLGCMGMSDFYGPADHSTNLAVLNHAIDIGVSFLAPWAVVSSPAPSSSSTSSRKMTGGA